MIRDPYRSDRSPQSSRVSRRAVLGGAAASGAALLAPLGPTAAAQSESTPEPKRGGTFVVATNSDPGPNPLVSDAYWIHGLYAEALTSIDEKGQIVPFLAEGWDVSPDVTTFTFTLRDSITLHNGRPLTSDDVKWSLERIKDPANQSFYGGFLANVTIDAPDSKTVRLTSSVPDVTLPAVAMFCPVVAPESFSAEGTPGQLIGTGPFVFDEYIAGEEIRTHRNDAYWRGAPYLDGVVVKTVPDPQARATALRSGSVDSVYLFAATQTPLIADDPSLMMQRQLFPYTTTLIFNVKNPQGPLADPRVRRAVALGLDRQEMLDAFVGPGGPGQVANQPYGPDDFWRLDLPDEFVSRDVDSARQLLAEAGVADGFSTSVMSVPDFRILAEVAQAQLSELGIQVEIEINPDFASEATRAAQYDWAMDASVWYPWFDPAIQFGWFNPSLGSFYAGGYADPEFGGLLDEARSITDVPTRKSLYIQAMNKLFHQDVVMLFLFTYNAVTVTRGDVRGYNAAIPHLNPASDGFGLRAAWLDR